MKTAYAAVKGIEVMRALRKVRLNHFSSGHALGEMCLVSHVFEI